MLACDREYDPEDLKGIQCYVCKEYGHLCCVDVALTSDRQDTCYNCGEVGHTGVGCAKSRAHLEGDRRSEKVCFRCGEEGHFARGCSKRDEDDPWDDFGTPAMGVQPTINGFQGFRSVPAVVEARRQMRDSVFQDRRVNTPPVRWPERWNMEEGERWNRGGLLEHEHYNRFSRGSKYVDDGGGYASANDWGGRTPKRRNKQNKGHRREEAEKASSSSGKRLWRKRQNH